MSYEKASNALPFLGGLAGTALEVLPNFQSIVSTVILAAIGAAVGYFVKIGLDKMIKK